ncbi:hypothetical protein ABIE19_002990 [Brevundimonas faecalis]|uniref:Uncharacterized protein n=1 Tax=Brevundimonas faecalis TaxID=947378 RepID=A0ABV2REN1_9CAUL
MIAFARLTDLFSRKRRAHIPPPLDPVQRYIEENPERFETPSFMVTYLKARFYRPGGILQRGVAASNIIGHVGLTLVLIFFFGRYVLKIG